jgi:hypothetical protein
MYGGSTMTPVGRPTAEPVKRSKRPLVIGVSIAAVALVVLGGLALSRRSTKRDTSANEQAPSSTNASPTTTPKGSTSAPQPQTPNSTIATNGKGALAGLVGPSGSPPPGEVLRSRMRAVKVLESTNYGNETYDSVIIVALAAEQAKSDGIELASAMNGVTGGGEKCYSYLACRLLLDEGKDIDYDGLSGPLEFGGNGESTVANFAVLTFGSNNRIDDSQSTNVEAKAVAIDDVKPVKVVGSRKGDGVLRIASLLPETGNLAFIGEGMGVAFNLAINDINASGGVLGKPVAAERADSGDVTSGVARGNAAKLVAGGADAIIGPASTGIFLSVIDQIVGAGVVVVSPASTGSKLISYDDKGLAFRVAGNDHLQAVAIAGLARNKGAQNVAIISRDDNYGTDLNTALQAALRVGGATIVADEVYPETDEDFSTYVAAIKKAKPDTVVVIGFEESAEVLRALVNAGLGPANVRVIGCDGNMGDALGERFDNA